MSNRDEGARFSSSHANAMSDLISEIHSENFSMDSWRIVLNLLGRAVPFKSAEVLRLTPGEPPEWFTALSDGSALGSHDEDASEILSLGERAAALKLSVWRITDAVAADEWEQSELRRRMTASGIGDVINVTCDVSPHEVTHVSLAKAQGGEEFSTGDAFLLRQVRHHYMQASRQRASRLDLTTAAEVFRQVMRPGFTCGPSGEMIDRNSELRRFISENSLNDEELVRSLEQTARQLIESGSNWCHIEMGDDHGRLSVHRLRLLGTTVRYAAVLDSHQYFRRVLRHRMQDAGLSAREVEICTLLIQGLSNKEIGQRVFISGSTVKDHVTNIIGKFSVSGRNEVLNKLLGYDDE